MKTKNRVLISTLAVLIFACFAFSRTDSNVPDLSFSMQPLTALDDVNSVWISLCISKTVGVPYIPDPNLNFRKIRERLKSGGINSELPPMLNRAPGTPLKPNLRIKIYIHSFDPTDPYIFYSELAFAKPVVVPSAMDSPFYAEVWHSDGIIGTASEQDLQEKINKSLESQIDDFIIGCKNPRPIFEKPDVPKDPNR
jgi:hypothetical protein